MAARRGMILIGCPSESSLCWDEDALINVEIPKSQPVPTWRRVCSLRSPIISTIRSKVKSPEGHHHDEKLPDVADRGELRLGRSLMSNAELSSQYYQESFSIHKNPRALVFTEDSILTTSDESPEEHVLDDAARKTLLLLNKARLTKIVDLPDSLQLSQMYPQTVTEDIVVGIIAAKPPQTIITRSKRVTVELIELVVGDGTKSGFCVNLWSSGLEKLSPDHCAYDEIRPRDIILFTNIALGSFQGIVHGQSLRRGLTGAVLLHRSSTHRSVGLPTRQMTAENAAAQLNCPNIQVLQQTYAWMLEHLPGIDASFDRSPLPPDTQ